METKLTANLDVVANSDLEIQMLDGDLNIIQKLDDEPNDVGGLSSAQLKAKFDESGNIIKKYINETLIPAVLADDATEASRTEAETARETAEQGRVTAEEGRVSAENARAEAETARASDESARAAAETARAAAEQARADENTGIVAQATAQATAAAQSAEDAEDARISARGFSNDAQTAATAAKNAKASAEAAQNAAETAESSAKSSAAAVAGINKTAQSWAVGGTGTREGEDTNNAKYWAQQAEGAAGGGVMSFNGRKGAVSPQSGDYTAEQVGAVPTTEKGAAGGVAMLGEDGKVPAGQLPAMDYAAKTHAATHASGGSDPITPASIGAAPAYTYGTADLTAGTSALATGQLYFVYE